MHIFPGKLVCSMIDSFVLLISMLAQRNIATRSVCIYDGCCRYFAFDNVNMSLAFYVLHHRSTDLFCFSLIDTKNNGFTECSSSSFTSYSPCSKTALITFKGSLVKMSFTLTDIRKSFQQ